MEIRLEDVNKHCLTEFRKHWECLDNSNQQLWQCRKWERPLNKCVFDNLVCHPRPRIRDAYSCQRIDWITNSQAEVGEEDTRCACKRGSCTRAQATDLRTEHHHPVEEMI
jgi:hypothetical protein